MHVKVTLQFRLTQLLEDALLDAELGHSQLDEATKALALWLDADGTMEVEFDLTTKRATVVRVIQ